MFSEYGELVGTLAIIFYIISVASFFVKLINKYFGKYIRKIPLISKLYKFLTKIIIRYHFVFGFITFSLVVFHFYIQYTSRGLSYTGILAAGIMFIQVLVGYFMKYRKKKNKAWLYTHRVIAVLVLIAIINHAS